MDIGDLSAAARYLEVRSAPVCADLAFVFGTGLPNPAHLAISLYEQNLVPFIVVTGGYNRKYDVVEAHQHRDILLGVGVPAQQIVVEDQSTNTLENVQFAMPFIAQRLPLAQVARVLVIAKWFHSRRAVMTLKRHMPGGIRYYPITYEPPGIARANWFEDATTRQYVMRNAEGISNYLARGHLAEIHADGDAFV